MNWADWAIIIIIGLSSLFGFWRGFVKEALSLLTWAAALIIAVSFRYPFASLLETHIATPSVRELIAFASLFIMTLIVGALVNRLVCELVKMTGLSGTDRIVGMLFGILRGVVIIMAFLVVLPSFISINEDRWWQESLIIPHFLVFEEWARSLFDRFVSLFQGLLG